LLSDLTVSLNKLAVSLGKHMVFEWIWIFKGFLINNISIHYSVISDKNFIKATKNIVNKTVLVMPVPDKDSDIEKAVFEALSLKADIVMYGPLDNASDKMKELLGVAITEAMEGEFKINSCLPLLYWYFKRYPDTPTWTDYYLQVPFEIKGVNNL